MLIPDEDVVVSDAGTDLPVSSAASVVTTTSPPPLPLQTLVDALMGPIRNTIRAEVSAAVSAAGSLDPPRSETFSRTISGIHALQAQLTLTKLTLIPF